MTLKTVKSTLHYLVGFNSKNILYIRGTYISGTLAKYHLNVFLKAVEAQVYMQTQNLTSNLTKRHFTRHLCTQECSILLN